MKNIEHCIRCKERACNAKQLEFEKPLSCIKCTPSETNTCNIIDKNASAIECDRTAIGYKNVCYTYQTGQTAMRGCLYEASDTIFDICKTNSSLLCSTCDQSDCNRSPITNVTIASFILNAHISERKSFYDQAIRLHKAENHLHCFQCNGTDECDLMSLNSDDFSIKPEPCSISSKYDQCFTYMQHEGTNINFEVEATSKF